MKHAQKSPWWGKPAEPRQKPPLDLGVPDARLKGYVWKKGKAGEWRWVVDGLHKAMAKLQQGTKNEVEEKQLVRRIAMLQKRGEELGIWKRLAVVIKKIVETEQKGKRKRKKT